MDELTRQYYETHAAEIADRYDSAASGVAKYFPPAFAQGMRVLDVGAGSSHDMVALRDMGCDVYGVEPCEELRGHALEHYAFLRGRLEPAELPNLGQPFGGHFDGVLCSAVLMHVPREQIFDAAFAIRNVLKENGRLLLSVPLRRPNLDDKHRDNHGRLFTPLRADYLQLLFERLGFQLIGTWRSEDGLDREGYSWCTLLFQRWHGGTLRPLDQIESILNRDRKTATYKLALFRALSEIAVTEFEQAHWVEEETVAIPVDVICQRWLSYYWPLFAASQFIPQIRGETQTCQMPVRFRASLTELIHCYEKNGGLTGFILDYRKGLLSQRAKMLLANVLEQMRRTIVRGPVTYAGGSLESGRIFRYNSHRCEIRMNAAIWHELSLLGHWIQDAVILRWAELTEEISNKQIKASEIIDHLLTTPIPERDVADAREIYAQQANECVWSERSLSRGFEVDHVIPFSLWRNNDLWNLLPVLPVVNREKWNRLPTRNLLMRRKDRIVECWGNLRSAYLHRFDYEACQLVGKDSLPGSWQNLVFQAVAEAVEVTAIQRGCERWEPS